MTERAFDPEVVALLKEVARDSKSELLRLPKGPLNKWAGRPEDVVSRRRSDLSRVENHLVEAYREEAAWVLLQACLAQLKRLPLVFPSNAPNAALVESSARRLNDNEVAGWGQQSALALVAAGQEVSSVQLGVASLRLAPSDVARNALAVAFHRSGRSACSVQLSRRVLSGEPSATQRAQAFEHLAEVYASRQDYARSFESCRRAAQSDESRVQYQVWCLTTALQAGEETRARHHSSLLEQHPGHEDLAIFARELTTGRVSGQWHPTAASARLISRLLNDVAKPVQEICHAFS